jgi:hypothetical protein
MDLRRLRVGEWITALSGLVLLISLFLPWYGSEALFARDPRETYSAWQSLAVIDVVLALVAAGAVGLAVITAAQRLPAVPLTFNVFLTLAAMLGVVLVLIRAIDLPDIAVGRMPALWLGVAGALGVLVGSLVALRDDRRSRPGRPTDLSGRPVAAPEPPDAVRPPRPEPQG